MATKKKETKKATDALAPGLAIGRELLEGFKQELADIKNPSNDRQNIWQTLSEAKQDEILDRYGRRIEAVLRGGYEAILTQNVEAAFAQLKKVVFNDAGIQALLDIPKNSSRRHALADFQGQQVLVVLTQDLDEYLESMHSVKADPDQGELPIESEGEAQASVFVTPESTSDLERAANVAAELGESDIDWSKKDRQALLDYIAWGEAEVAKRQEIPAA